MRLNRVIPLAAGVLLALAVPAVAHAGGHSITPGAPCSTPGATGTHNGSTYICQQKPSDNCPVWHVTPHSGPHTTPWSHGPCPKCTPKPSPSASATPSPSASASTTPSATPSASATPSGTPSTTPSPTGTPGANASSAAGAPQTSPAGTLPVTGSNATAWALSGLVALVLGAIFWILGTRPRRNLQTPNKEQ